MPVTQENRFIGIQTPLGADALALCSFSYQEQLGRLFQIEAELCSEDGEVDFDEVIGHNATIRLDLADNQTRYFDGYVSRLVQVVNRGGYARYRATIVPWLWFLSRTSDCRIFQDLTVPEVIEEVFKGFGFSDYELRLSGSYSKWEYCVQYRETSFNFVSRLMEQEGICYFFEHEEGKHTLVLADSISAHNPFPGYARVKFHELETGAADKEVVTGWTAEKEVQPVAFALNDFDFKKPKNVLLSSSNVSRAYGKAEYEIYDYPGEYVDHSDGDRLADVRLAELQSQYETLHGEANCRGLAAGAIFDLESHPRDDQNRSYLITGVSLQADAGEFAAAGNSPEEIEFVSCSFTAIDKEQQFRPGRLTAKPVVQGPQTAIVVGPQGEEIHTDAHARVKVQFHWDRYGKFDENSSCWVRVSQPWAGKGWGSMATPRIGQEVIVDFLEGDPDRPIITGRVYNGDCKPPYAGGQGVVSGLKSKTHKGSGDNELSMDDTPGKENFKIHAQHDMNTVVGNNQSNTVGVDQTENVGSNRTVEIGANDKLTVGANREVSIGANDKLTVGANRDTSIGGSHAMTVGGKDTVSVSGVSSLTVGGKRSETIGGAHMIANPKMTINSGSKYSVTAGSKITESSPSVNILAGSKLKATSGGKVDVKAGSKLTQQSGAATNIKAGGALKAQSGAALSLKAGAAMKAQASGGMSLKAGGAITQKGSVIKLNSPTKIKGTTLTVS